MRILMTADPIGGVWTYALDLCAGLQSLGAEVALATLGAPLRATQRRAVASLRRVTLHESRFRLEWMQDPWTDLAAAGEWLLDIAGEFDPDSVHLNHLTHADLPWGVPVVVVGHSCVLSWWAAVHGGAAPRSWARYREAVGRSLRAATRVVAPTRAMLAGLQRHYGPLPASQVIPNGRDPSPYRPLSKEPLILSAGRLWDPAKNLAALASIAPGLPWPMHVAGATRGPDGARADAGSLRLLGRLDAAELAGWYGRASVYALPARYEPFGLTALEAALSGCALVLGDIASLREVWGEAACYVAPDDVPGLRDALLRLIEDPALRRQAARRALEQAARYSLSAAARAYWVAHRQLIAASSVPLRPLLPAPG